MSLVTPSLLPWVVIGAGIGLTPWIVRRWNLGDRLGVRLPHRTQGKQLLTAATILLVVLVVVSLVLLSSGSDVHFSRVSTVVVEGTYDGRTTLGSDPERLQVGDELVIAEDTIEAAAQEVSETPGLLSALTGRSRISGEQQRVRTAERALKRRIRRALKDQGWTAEPPTTAGLAFTRKRQQAVQLPALKAQQANTLTIPHVSVMSRTGSPGIELAVSEDSAMVVSAEKHAIGDTYPEGKTQVHQAGDLVETTIPVPQSGDEIELQVRRPLFRNALAAEVAEITTGAVLKWFLLIGLALTQDEIKALLKRGLSRLVARPAKGGT